MTAKANAVESKTNAVNAADNTNLEALKDQAYDAAKADAEKLLGDAVSQNKKIKDNLKTGDLHINGYEGWNGKHNSNVAIKIHYADDTFTEGEKTTDQAVVDEKNSSTTLSVSYTGTYQQKNSKDLGAQTVETQKYNQTAKAEEKQLIQATNIMMNIRKQERSMKESGSPEKMIIVSRDMKA